MEVEKSFYYIFRELVLGDSLWGIAATQLGSGSRYQEIKNLNGLQSDTIYPGNVLVLPQ